MHASLVAPLPVPPPDRFNRCDLSSQALKAWQLAHPELAPDFGEPMPPMTINHDYDQPKKELPMSTTSPLTPAEQFRADMMTQLDNIHSQINTMADRLEEAVEKMTSAVNIISDARRQIEIVKQTSQPAVRPQAGETITFLADRITRTSADGKKYYRMRGGMYTKFGISVWPEVLTQIGLGEIVFDDHDAYTISPPLLVRALVEEYTAKDGTIKTGPQKVIGLA